MPSLLSYLSGPPVTGWISAAWITMLVLCVLLHVAVYLVPRGLARYNALPWAFQLRWNLDLDFQSVTYAAVHETRMARWSHLTLPAEQVAWAVLLLSLHPAALLAVVALVLWQAALLGEPPLVAGVAAMWAVIAALGFLCLHTLGPVALTASELLLLVGPPLRFLGHVFEPIPPFVGASDDTFIPLREVTIRPALAGAVLGGIVSEFAAALPHRLIVVQLFWLAQQLGYAPRRARPWDEARVVGAAIRTRGWKAYEKTRQLVALGPVPDTAVPATVADV